MPLHGEIPLDAALEIGNHDGVHSGRQLHRALDFLDGVAAVVIYDGVAVDIQLGPVVGVHEELGVTGFHGPELRGSRFDS